MLDSQPIISIIRESVTNTLEGKVNMSKSQAPTIGRGTELSQGTVISITNSGVAVEKDGEQLLLSFAQAEEGVVDNG